MNICRQTSRNPFLETPARYAWTRGQVPSWHNSVHSRRAGDEPRKQRARLRLGCFCIVGAFSLQFFVLMNVKKGENATDQISANYYSELKSQHLLPPDTIEMSLESPT